MTMDALITQIETLPHVTGVTTWSKAGHTRLYIETAKFNGGKTYNGGKGYRVLYVDVTTKKVVAQDVAGAATRDKLAATRAQIAALAATLEG